MDEIRHRYASKTVRLRTPNDLGALPGVQGIEKREDAFVLTLDGITPQQLLKIIVERNIAVESFEVATAPLQEVFIAVVKEGHNG